LTKNLSKKSQNKSSSEIDTTISLAGNGFAPVEGTVFRESKSDHRQKLCAVCRSSAADTELALDAAHKSLSAKLLSRNGRAL
jgi:hypothetical protein